MMARDVQMILMADDDLDDCDLTREALSEACPGKQLFCVHDGVELLDYLHGLGAYENRENAPLPTLILLDLNMPKLDGYGALRALKADEALASIPVVIITTSASPTDVETAYRTGAQSYIVKPSSFSALVDKLRVSGAYWFEVAAIPGAEA